MGCGNKNFILGLPWLKKANPNIDWVTEMVTILKYTDQMEAFNHKTGITVAQKTVPVFGHFVMFGL